MKRNKNGFTLIELLAVIVILGIIMTIATTNVIKSINNSREKSKEIAKKEIISYAEAYFATNNSNTDCVSVEKLYDLGYLTGDVTNPETGKNITNKSELGNQKICKTSASNTTNTTEINGYKYIITPKDSNDSTDNNKHDSNDATEDNKKQDLNKEDNKKQDSNVSKTYKIGDRFCLKSECFYVIKDNGTTVDALAKQKINTKTNRQDKNANALAFAERTNGEYGYWTDSNGKLLSKYGTGYPANVFDSNSTLYEPVQSYKTYLKNTLKKTSVDARLITYEELISLGCSRREYSCESAPSWVFSVAYWTASATHDDYVHTVASSGVFVGRYFDTNFFSPYSETYGLRPVITINKNEI